MLKNIVRAMVMSGVIVVFAPATQTVQAAGGGQAFDFRQAWIVGSWLGTIDNGEQILMSFNVDGVAFSSFQGEVKTTAPVLTAAHGAWTYVGGRQFAFTTRGILYDIQTGVSQGSAKVRAVLTLDRSGDRMNCTVKVDVLAPDGSLVVSFPHTIQFTRIKVERLD